MRVWVAWLTLLGLLAPIGLNLTVPLSPAFDGTPLSAAQRGALTALCALGMAIGQLVFGSIADRFGRRPALLAGLAVTCAGAGWCAAAVQAPSLLIGRALLGLGLGAVLVVSRSTLRDLASGPALASAMATATLAFALGPALTPPLAWLLASRSGDWRLPLMAYTTTCLLVMTAAWIVQRETRPFVEVVEPRATSSAMTAWRTLWAMPTVRCDCFGFAAGAAPFFVVIAHAAPTLQATVGWGSGAAAFLVGGSALGFLVGNVLVMITARRTGVRRIYRLGQRIAAFGLLWLLLVRTESGEIAWIGALVIYGIGHGMLFPSAIALVLQAAPRFAGRAAAAVGALQMATGAAAAWLVGVLPGDALARFTLVTLAAAFVGVALSSLRAALMDQSLETTS